MLSKTTIKNLVQGIQYKEPRLYDVLMALVGRLDNLEIDINDVTRVLRQSQTTSISGLIEPPGTFSYVIYPNNITISWSLVVGAAMYELRKGTDWDTADRITITNSNSAALEPLIYGTHTYLIKSLDFDGAYSDETTTGTVIIPIIPAVPITSQVIDNNVLLYWNSAISSFRITNYIVKRNGTEVGNKDGTFTTVFETLAGSYRYSIIPVDVAGNLGTESFIDVAVSEPPDYVLRANITDDFSGTKLRTIVEDNQLLCSYVVETWEAHFAARGWSCVQDQIDAGYSKYMQPTASWGKYIQTFDLGAAPLTNVIVNLTWAAENLAGTSAVTVTMEFSEDEINWTSPIQGWTAFASIVRYVRATFTFTALS